MFEQAPPESAYIGCRMHFKGIGAGVWNSCSCFGVRPLSQALPNLEAEVT